MSIRSLMLSCTAFAILAVSVSCARPVGNLDTESDLSRNTSPDVVSEDLDELVRGNTDFALDLYHKLAEDQEGENLFFSPHSISIALAMTYAGARSSTETEMAETLHFNLPQDSLHPTFNTLDLAFTERNENVQLNVANSIWGQEDYRFLPDFLDTLEENYGAGIRLVDFVGDPEVCRVTINDWVYEETREKIEDLIPPGLIDELIRLVLVNAIYFKANWLTMFDEEDTYDGPFRLLDGETVTVPLMNMDEEEFPYTDGDGYRALLLPYTGEQLSMLIILPDLERFREIESSIDREFIDNVIQSIYETEVDVQIPRFEMRSKLLLANTLSSMGMPSAFVYGVADFSGMDGTTFLFIYDVVHEAYVKVNEEGTEAAAATAVAQAGGVVLSQQFIADHPFIFLIRDNDTGAILFMGRVMDPS